ncbi:MAG TPA: outer membrane lipoprotein carrier protein LolA [Rhizomicrobium sp.]|jgi:outer membrane lipoprotein-sorting protein|nr:outer membrane lipoprotein carrier protein LolA [Rhizomicrobium sp.]
MRRLLYALLVAFSSVALTGAGQMAPQARPSFSDAQKADLDRISAYLNSIHTLKGRFTQIDGNGGMAGGTFFLQKPGKIRFEYAPPAQLLVVSDGYAITVLNKKLNTTNRYPLSSSPLDFVLSNTLNLKVNPYVTGVEHNGNTILVKARSAKNRVTGNITMVFSEPSLALQQWTIVDAQGGQTTVSLDDVQSGMAIPGSTFVLSADTALLKKTQE